MVLPQATFLVSNGNNIFPCNFPRFAASDIKGQQGAAQVECYNLVTKLTVSTGR